MSAIKDLRIARGLSRSRLAELSHVSRSQISRLEEGVSEMPHGATLHALAAALGVDAAELADRIRQPVYRCECGEEMPRTREWCPACNEPVRWK